MITLKHKTTGQEVRWQENEPYNGWEWAVVPGSSTTDREANTLEVELEKNGIRWGDAVAWVTKKIGLTQCAPCRARQEILNNFQLLGLKETVRQIKETYGNLR